MLLTLLLSVAIVLLTTTEMAMRLTADTKRRAAALLDNDNAVGVHGWPLGCYVSEAVENELDAMSQKEKAKDIDARQRIAYRRVINMSGSYAEQWGLDIDTFRAAVALKSF